MTREQVMKRRIGYKQLVGVNVSKHIRVRLQDRDMNLMKACYATALGQWESEALWVYFWYQDDKTRRELLIEALMGRTNDEITAIKHAFKDKKYSDSLTEAMEAELKEDKFKRAVLEVLLEARIEDYGHSGQLPIDKDFVEDGADLLRKATLSEEDGETAMLGVVVQRSDSHLHEIM
ncbi:hypothetical protein QQZ08_001320 [Neonectria magnoliae]|uniref:Annexin n=1 Tax=Neonectria magnoliae TaxID=2732573 RepID=A0ABR1IEG5_9HYPO